MKWIILENVDVDVEADEVDEADDDFDLVQVTSIGGAGIVGCSGCGGVGSVVRTPSGVLMKPPPSVCLLCY